MISEQPADPDDPGDRRLPQRADRARTTNPGSGSRQRADREFIAAS